MQRFKSKYELLYSGWIVRKVGEDYVFSNSETPNVVTINMLSTLPGKTKEECLTNYPNHVYDDLMFIDTEGNIMDNDNIKLFLTKDEYSGHLKWMIYDLLAKKEYQSCKEYLDRLTEHEKY